MDDKELVNYEIKQYLQSELFNIRCKSKQYYKNNNDITQKKRYTIIDGVREIATNVENNIISHPIYRDLVDQKINYLLGNDWNVDNDELAELFDDNFRVMIERVSSDAIMYGVGWFFALPDGTFRYVDGLGVIPVWLDINHTKLNKVIKMYSQLEYRGKEKKEIEYAELWTVNGVKTYEKDGDEYKEITNKSHMIKVDEENKEIPLNWKDVPFIYIKYNQDELPLLTLVKSLIDKMDKTASDTQDLLSDLTNKVGVISGATGTDPKEFNHNKKLYRLAILPQGANYTEVGTDPDITAAKTWIEHLRSQIYIAGRGYDPLQAIGANASGEARRNLYTSLDLDVNQLESGVLEALKRCIKFINASPGTTTTIPDNVKIKFTRNIMVNKAEQVDIALKAQQLEGASKELALSVSGLTDNPKEEIKKAEREQEDELNKQADIFNNQDNKPFIQK